MLVQSLPKVYAEQSWFFYYELAKNQMRKGLYGPAIVSLQRAIRQNPTPQKRARTYGMNFISYYPYFYLAKALYQLNKFKEARVNIDKSFKYGAILEDPKMAAEASALKESILNKLQLLKPSQPPKPVQEKPQPQTEPPTEARKEPEDVTPRTPVPQPPRSVPSPKPVFIPRPVMKTAMSYYENHQYMETIQYLQDYIRENPDRPAVLAYFLIGLSYANLYYLGGESDQELLIKAQKAFRKARPLPLFIKQKLKDMVSPKILKIYQESG